MFASKLSSLIRIACILMYFSLEARADIAGISREISSKLPPNVKIAIQPLDRTLANLSVDFANSLIEKFTNQLQIAIQDTGSVLIDRSKIDVIMLEQEEFQDVEEFSSLIKNTGAEVLVALSVARIDNDEVEISARAFGVKGDEAGKVLSASNSYRLTSPSKFVVKLASLREGNRDRMEYSNSVLEGLSNYSELEVAPATVPDHQIDYVVDVQISITSAERATAESKKAQGQAQGFAMFNSFTSGMGGNSRAGKNPFAGLTQMTPDPESLKKVVFISDAEATITNTGVKSKLVSITNAETTVGKSASKEEKKRAAAQSVRKALAALGFDIGAKLTGKSSGQIGENSLLD